MKTKQLLDLLTKKERNDFCVVMKNNKRGTIYRLLVGLLKQKNQKRTDLFEIVFDKEYQEEKDYLLRNEFRLLNQHLEHFIAYKDIDSRTEKLLFLKILQKKGSQALFEKEIKKEIKKRERANDYKALADLHQLVLDGYLSHKSFTAVNLQKMMDLNDQILFFKRKRTLYEERESLVTKAFIAKMTNPSSEKLIFADIERIPGKYNDAYLSYLKHKAYGYVRHGKAKRKNLQKALSLIDEIVYDDFDKQLAKVTTLSNLALEYLFVFEYQNALTAYEQLIPLTASKGITHYSVLFNYLNCLLKAKAYDKAIDLIKSDFSSRIIDFPVLLEQLECIKAMAWIFIGELDLAYKELSPNTKKSVRNNYFYSRLVLTIIFYLEGNIELAKRENNNILQIIEEENELRYLKFCAKKFRKFLLLEDPIKDNIEKRHQLWVVVNNFICVENKGSDLLPLLWLKEQLVDEK